MQKGDVTSPHAMGGGAKGQHNTITLKKVAATVASKTDLHFKTLEKKS